jgi:organic radical activating enzyme
MLIHSMLPRSAVNGPGERVVVWLQGCDLRCPGCWNPSSHGFDRSRDKPVDEVGEWILSCQGVEGVTVSGGEPFQQALELRLLCEYLKLRQPSFSIGLFTGYTMNELAQGLWRWMRGSEGTTGSFTRSNSFWTSPSLAASGRRWPAATNRSAVHAIKRWCS